MQSRTEMRAFLTRIRPCKAVDVDDLILRDNSWSFTLFANITDNISQMGSLRVIFELGCNRTFTSIRKYLPWKNYPCRVNERLTIISNGVWFFYFILIINAFTWRIIIPQRLTITVYREDRFVTAVWLTTEKSVYISGRSIIGSHFE